MIRPDAGDRRPETGDRRPGTTPAAIIVISDRDNVATALEPLEQGRSLEIGRHVITVRDAVPSGHKIALARIGAGEAVVKYGSPIGTATTDIEPGAHVHVHNLASTRGRGDLAPADEAERPS